MHGPTAMRISCGAELLPENADPWLYTFAMDAKVTIESLPRHLDLLVNIAEFGSLSETARALSITPSTVARRLDALEADVHTQLFIRTTRTLRLTRAGE